ncbi:MAG TPA: hypothetical protein VK472_06590 [Allosphingosinicella sp.]|nr:hypothetical protein [Allosphingosinicella sp.]
MIAPLLPVMMMLAPPTIENRSDKVIDLFVQVCLKGEARFRKGDAKKVASNAMPWRMGWNTQGQFYEIQRPVSAWVAVRDRPAGDYSRRCRVGAKYVDVRSAADRVRSWLREPPLPNGSKLSYYEEYYLDGGARFEVESGRWVDFTILTSYVLTPQAADRQRRKRAQ